MTFVWKLMHASEYSGDKVKCAVYYVIQGVSVISDRGTAGFLAASSHMKPASVGHLESPHFSAVKLT